MKKSMKILVLFSLLLISFNVMADKRKEFIRKYKHIAIREMERTGIPASITLAQGISIPVAANRTGRQCQ